MKSHHVYVSVQTANPTVQSCSKCTSKFVGNRAAYLTQLMTVMVSQFGAYLM